MRNRKVFLRIFALASLLFPAVGIDLNAQQSTWRIAALFWSMNIPGQVAMRSGLEAEASAFNSAQKQKVQLIPYVAGDGEKGIENQIKQMRQAVASKVSAIIVQPTDNAALAAPLREANAAGIPVIAYDQYISGGKLAAYRTSDNYMAGRLDGEYLSSRFPAGR